MVLWQEVTIISLFMVVCAALPLFWPLARRHAADLFLLGTGAMFGICFFDLVPDVFALGGGSSLWIMGGVWALYSVAHLLHLGHHHPHAGEEEDGHAHTSSFGLFFGSLAAHCFASGMLLAVSAGLSRRVAVTVFVALLAHKIYESLLLASILMLQRRSAGWRAGMIALYAAGLPAGAAATALFEGSINQQVAVLISSVAVGTLLGCLIFDFLLPSLSELRRQRVRAAWILAGLLLTQWVMHEVG
jgi:zinc transporter ZupT